MFDERVVRVAGVLKSVPFLVGDQVVTPEYIKALDAAIGSDGCTKSPDFYRSCCVLHDLYWRCGLDEYGKPLTECEANNRLRKCQRSKSWFRRWFGFSPVAGVYWVGVTVGGVFHKQPVVAPEEVG